MHAVKIVFDSAKDRRNRAHHGLPLAFGARVIAAAVADIADVRRDYGELRRNAYGHVESRFFVCTYTRRGDAYRIISVRRANRREEARYGERR